MLNKLSIAVAVLGLCGITWGKIAKPPAAPLPPDFAINLYQELAKADGNIFFSPASIQSALAMAANGAKGETAKQMDDVLSIINVATFSKALASLNQVQDTDTPPFKLTIANAMWAQNAYPFDVEYVKRIRTMFAAEAKGLDFVDEEASRKAINGWVEEKTSQKIKDLIAPGALTADTRLVLTNAVYFNANWAEKFEKGVTADGPFTTPTGAKTVPMMRRTDRFGYADGGDFHVVSVPYSGFTTSMLLIVPKTSDGLAKTEKALTPEWAKEAFKQMGSRSIDLSLPRFKIEQSISLRKVLSVMGMTLAFDPNKADFSGMTTAEKLSISDVIHKAYVKVDEEGTEAAAATAVIMRALAMPMPEENLKIKVDHPFVFMVRDNRTGVILFMGRVANPE